MLYQCQNPHGGDIYGDPVTLDFSANTNPLGTPQAILDAVKESLPSIHRYPDPYCRKLVAKISEFEQVDPGYILCGNGAAELIYACCQAMQVSHAVEAVPTFAEYALGLEKTGCTIAPYFLKESLDFRPDDGFLSFLEAEKPEAVFLCNPNNPSGQLMDEGLALRILDFCRETNCYLFLDECFLDLTEDGRSLKDHLADTPQLLILKAFTKSYGMAGIRLGYCLSSNSALLARMSAAVQPWNVSTPAQAAGIAALDQQSFLERTRVLVRQQRRWLAEQLEALGFRVCPSRTNFLLFRGPEGLHLRLKALGISIRNCDNYLGLGPGWYRIAVRLEEENRALIRAIAQTERK